jgi:hypothetical protein
MKEKQPTGLVIPGRTESRSHYFLGLKPGLDSLEVIHPFSLTQFKPDRFIQGGSYDIAIYDGLKYVLWDDEPDEAFMRMADELRHFMGQRAIVPTLKTIPDEKLRRGN